MATHMVTGALPRIVLSETDELVLSNLAIQLNQRDPSNRVVRTLLAELQRADIVPDAQLPASIVRMNSIVEFETDTGERRKGQLVFPGRADIAKGQISILTPIGAALIGLSKGQTMRWQGHDGRPHALTVVSVKAAEQP